MNQTESPSSDDSKCLGYRLDKLEVYNWGTFDHDVFSVRPNGQTTLLVGQNGSGKSTVVDALLTLLVKPGVRNFNVAAGAKKTERELAEIWEREMRVAEVDWRLLAKKGSAWMSYWDRHVRGSGRRHMASTGKDR